MKALFDTNILIDYLTGYKQAEKEISKYKDPSISVITWMEVLAGTESSEENEIKNFLNTFRILQLTTAIAEEAVSIRKEFKIKLPDSIIWATARVNGMFLVTRNIKDFKKSYSGIHIPYKV
ncbi:MAG: type II toxin-antitoxin system VapC family toxin [Leptospiraceae bacterium]|nr:type II toxin-antitoxin system VapC family toxin [Leptospiraceae bacterium]